MKKELLTWALAALTAGSAAAQEPLALGRGRIENVTDYSQPVISRHHRIGTRATAPLPCTGSPKVPVILVQFNDLTFTTAGDTDAAIRENYQKFCNGTGIPGQPYRPSGGSYGSVSDYFIAQSDSLFQPEFAVIGPVTLPESYAFYGKDEYNSQGVSIRKDVNISKMYSDACKLAVNNFQVNWSDFDNNNDGKVDFVFFIYAGIGQNDMQNDDDNTIWPKELTSTLTVQGDNGNIVFGACGCACEAYNGAQDGIGTMCHELSHGLGLPDLYDTQGDGYGMDYWDVMDSGCYQLAGMQPCEYSAYERDFMGWRPLQKVTKDEAVTLKLEPIEQGGYGYVVTNDGQPSGNEYFILENRQNYGFDLALGCRSVNIYKVFHASHGLLITHVDYLQSDWTSNTINVSHTHPRFTIVPADGTLLSSYNGINQEYMESFQGDIYPGTQNVTEISSYEVYKGTFTQKINNINETVGGVVSVDINGGSADAIESLTTAEASTPVAYYTPAGQRIAQPQKGINIVRDGANRVKKIWKR